MNIKIIKLLDACLGRALTTMLSPTPESAVPEPVKTILIIRPGGIGDAVLLSPAILSIKKKYPSVHITVLGGKRNAGAFSLIQCVDRILRYDLPKEIITVFQNSYDVVIDTEQWHRLSAVVARLVQAPLKIGFNTNERRRMFTHTIPYSQDDYETTNFANLMAPLYIDSANIMVNEPFLSIPDDSKKYAEILLASLQGKTFITLFPGASIPERRWGKERFQKVAELLSIIGVAIVVVGGKEDQLQGEVIVSNCSGLNLAGLTSLAETAAVISQSALLVSGDSGVLHIAVGLGVPTVSLFGPGRAKKWAPRGAHHIVINKELPCSPCTTFGTTPPCPINARCMQEISVDEVVNAVKKLLSSMGAIPVVPSDENNTG